MKCELKVIRYASRGWLTIGTWKALVVRVSLFCLTAIIAIPIANFCEVSHINSFCVGGVLGLTMYLLAWGSCRKGEES